MKKISRMQQFFNKFTLQKAAAVFVALVVVLVGYLVIRSTAGGFFAAAEAEGSSLTAPAKIIDDATASGGKALQFAEAVTTPPPTNPPSTKPTAANTGIPPGTQLTDYTGARENRDSNKTFTNTKFPGGGYIFWGSNLTFRNCKFESGVIFEGNNITLDHCDIAGDVSLNNTVGANITYNNIHHWGDALHITSEKPTTVVKNINFSYNYAHTPQLSCGAHSDGVQLLGIDGFTATYNNIDMGKQFNLCGDANPLNATFQIKTDFTGVINKNMRIENNWLNGGGYTVRLYQCASSTFANNRFGRDDTWGPIVYEAGNCLTNRSGNVYDDNNAPINF